MSTEEEATISYPSIAIVAFLGFLLYRYFFAPKRDATNNNGGSASSSSTRNGMRFTIAQVDQVSQMFPQLNRRDIMYDLQRNRGNAQSTIERMLTGRGLEPAPPTFQPPLLASAAPASSSPSTAIGSKQAPRQPDLITRYNLGSRLDPKGKEKETSLASGWATTKEARQSTLQRRRDEMILAARRKMQEKDASAT